MSNIDKIHQEIERRLQQENEILWNAKKRGTYPSPSCEYNLLTLTSLRDFIDSLPEEKLSLPSNLAEAAEESMPEEEWFLEIDIYGGSEAVYSREQMLAMFKAGAEWMAKQGVSTVAISNIEDGITEEGMKSIADYLESLPDKTEVVLQIRKKQ